MHPRLSAPSLLASMLVAVGCNQLVPIGAGDQPCVPVEVQAAFDRSCAFSGCHDAATAAAGLELTASGSVDVLVLDATQQPLPLVVIGDTQGSYLAQKLVDAPSMAITGARMPIAFDPSNMQQSDDVTTILAWIAGAPFSDCGSGGGGGTTSGGVMSDLPCEIEDLLDRRCRSCHSDPPISAPMPMITHDDLLAGSPSDPQVSVAQRSLERMTPGAALPMPPAPGSPVTATELAAFTDWLDAGAPVGSCGGGGGVNPFDADPVCTSNRYWSGDDGSPQMSPGRDCVACHDTSGGEAPRLLIGGTVYPSGHEPDNCYGTTSTSLRVVIRSASGGNEVTLTPGSAGNFSLYRSQAPAGFAPPFSVKLVAGDRERVMTTAASSGSCNACHTQNGTQGAPGRIVAP